MAEGRTMGRSPAMEPDAAREPKCRPTDPLCVMAGQGWNEERARPFPPHWGDTEQLVADGWLYCAACDAAM